MQSTLSDSVGIKWGIPDCHGSGWKFSVLWDVMPFRLVEVAVIEVENKCPNADIQCIENK
jgi:hypothetical protein